MPHTLQSRLLARDVAYRSGWCPYCKRWEPVHVKRSLIRCPEGHILTAIRDATADTERESTEQSVADVIRHDNLVDLRVKTHKDDLNPHFTPNLSVTTTIRRQFRAARTRCYR